MPGASSIPKPDPRKHVMSRTCDCAKSLGANHFLHSWCSDAFSADLIKQFDLI